MDIPKKRFASGEITKEKYRKSKKIMANEEHAKLFHFLPLFFEHPV
jgi:hypothetical protein